MNHQTKIQVALRCLQEIEEHESVSAADISNRRHIAVNDCVEVLGSLSQAGIIRFSNGLATLQRPIETITSLEVLQALWKSSAAPAAFRFLAGDRTEGSGAVLRALVNASVGSEEVARG